MFAPGQHRRRTSLLACSGEKAFFYLLRPPFPFLVSLHLCHVEVTLYGILQVHSLSSRRLGLVYTPLIIHKVPFLVSVVAT
jgi:hypothetical protein